MRWAPADPRCPAAGRNRGKPRTALRPNEASPSCDARMAHWSRDRAVSQDFRSRCCAWTPATKGAIEVACHQQVYFLVYYRVPLRASLRACMGLLAEDGVGEVVGPSSAFRRMSGLA